MEIWKKIKGFPRYKISNKGRLLSFLHLNYKRGRLKGNPSIWGGYKNVVLIHNSKQRSFYIHRLVAMHFVPNKHPRKHNLVNHKNGNKLDNNYENLEWTDKSGDAKHAWKLGLRVLTKKMLSTMVMNGKRVGREYGGWWNTPKALRSARRSARMMAQMNKGKTLSSEHRQKISAACVGRSCWNKGMTFKGGRTKRHVEKRFYNKEVDSARG